MTDLISRADAIEVVCRTRCGDKAKGCPAHSCPVIEEFDALPSAETHGKRTETHGVCLISKDDAMGAVQDHFNADGFKGYDDGQKMMDRIKALPSADTVDCTDFIEWLVDRVLDETIWEYNSVAYGEIICRKLEKLGILEVTEEPSYYIRPSADAVPQSEQYKKGFEDAKRAFLVEYARESENMRKRNAQLEVMLNIQRELSTKADWIPCSERLPSVNGDEYLVTDYCPQINRRRIRIAYCYVNKLGFWSDTPKGYEVLAWMPLPKPYKGGDSE